MRPNLENKNVCIMYIFPCTVLDAVGFSHTQRNAIQMDNRASRTCVFDVRMTNPMFTKKQKTFIDITATSYP